MKRAIHLGIFFLVLSTFLENDRVEYKISLSLYGRHTSSPYWFNGSRNLISTNLNFGIRYRF